MTRDVQPYRILVADDDPFIVSLYRGKLTQAGMAVEVAKNGEETLRHLSAAKPSLVLLDLNMPRVDGLQVLRFIRENETFRDLPVVVLSNACTPELLEKVGALNPTRFLSKRENPPNQVVQEIQNVLGEVPATQPPLPEPREYPAAAAGASGNAERRKAAKAVREATSDEARREALLELYQCLQEDLRRLRRSAPLTLARQAGEAMEQFFEDLYVQPDALSPDRADLLAQWVDRLPQLLSREENGPVDSLTVLIVSEQADDRSRWCEIADRPGFRPLAVRREATALEVMEENSVGFVVWEASKRSAARHVWKRIRETAAHRRTGLIFVLPADKLIRQEDESFDPQTAFAAYPGLSSELRLILFRLREEADSDPTVLRVEPPDRRR